MNFDNLKKSINFQRVAIRMIIGKKCLDQMTKSGSLMQQTP